MGQWVEMNFVLADRIEADRTKLNLGSRLRLFKTLITPTPADSLLLYTAAECDFDTYSIAVLTGKWQAAAKVIDGEYQIATDPISYASPNTLGNTIYGAFMDDAAGHLLRAMLFDLPILFAIGAPELELQPVYQVWSLSLT